MISVQVLTVAAWDNRAIQVYMIDCVHVLS